MDDKSLAGDYQALGVAPDASWLEVERAYFHMRTLYAEGSLASYGLFEPSQLQQRRQEIELAFARITDSRRKQTKDLSPELAGADHPSHDHSSPAALLWQTRQQTGMSLKEVAKILKIGYLHLQNIEEERFEDLPPTVYLRGFLLSYAKVLKIPNPENLARDYLARRPPGMQGA
jgi:hypothetical protein